MIPDRSLEVLRAIVQDYIASKEPVGSKSLVERHAFGVSAATIRNDMAFLEEEELIHAPHTSAGRVPTDKGYRLFVDRLSEVKPLNSAERQAIESFMVGSADLDETLGRTVRLLSQLTNQVAMVQYPTLGKASVRHLELIPAADTRVLMVLITNSGRIQQHVVELGVNIDESFISDLRQKLNSLIAGVSLVDVKSKVKSIATGMTPEQSKITLVIVKNLLEQVDANRQEKIILSGTSNLAKREEDFPGSISPVLEAIEEQVVLLKLIGEMQTEQHGVSLRIGRENSFEGLANASVVVSGYENQGSEIAKLGVIGPTRMDYSTNISAVLAVARYLTKTLGN
ncbi:MAG: heat-inducible transcriptional repressor HrcA [Rhodoluna sp.]|jgi:heat-inducible transcriptional repressor|nr:heat-inducible transcriptional repressor HrcA [Rhodoluna sp.]